MTKTTLTFGILNFGHCDLLFELYCFLTADTFRSLQHVVRKKELRAF